MRFRPCIDIHNGKVKQIIGNTLRDQEDRAVSNFTSGEDAAYYARLYKRDRLKGGHIILLNQKDSVYYEKTRRQALLALSAYPGGMQVGGGVDAENAAEYLRAGASHVIVTSYIFQGGTLRWDHLKKLVQKVGKEHIVLDLSCRRKKDAYYIVTDRWQTFTEEELTFDILCKLSDYCDEFLVHGVDVEGKASGMEEPLVELLAAWNKKPVTYAGGIGSLAQLERFSRLSKKRLDFTIGSALDLFGGTIPYEIVAGL